MSAAYDRVRKALEGTPLAGDLDRLNAELHLTPEAAEWVIAALTVIGTAALTRDLHAVESALGTLPETLDTSMRAAGAEIVRGLGDEIAHSTTAAIRSDTAAVLKQMLDGYQAAVHALTRDLSSAAQATTKTAESETVAALAEMREASSWLCTAAARVGGWTPARLASIGLGAVLIAGSFTVGNAAHLADVAFGCSARVARVTQGLHLSPHVQNTVRAYICKN